jgi:hypothetical protein
MVHFLGSGYAKPSSIASLQPLVGQFPRLNSVVRRRIVDPRRS